MKSKQKWDETLLNEAELEFLKKLLVFQQDCRQVRDSIYTLSPEYPEGVKDNLNRAFSSWVVVVESVIETLHATANLRKIEALPKVDLPPNNPDKGAN